MRVAELTLAWEAVGGVHIGFTSPTLVRLHLWCLGLIGRLQSFESVRMDGVCCKGWTDGDATYVTRVWLDDMLFKSQCAEQERRRVFSVRRSPNEEKDG